MLQAFSVLSGVEEQFFGKAVVMQVDRGGPEVKWPGRGEGGVEAVGSLPLVALCVLVFEQRFAKMP